MQAAPKPINEAARLRSLSEYRILGTKPEKAFDNITRMASEICQSPIALISLVDEKRQWFKSKVGLEASETDINHHQFRTAAVIEWRRWSGWQMERTAEKQFRKKWA